MKISNSKFWGVIGAALLLGFMVSGCQSPPEVSAVATPEPIAEKLAPEKVPAQSSALTPVIESAPRIPVATATITPGRVVVAPRIPVTRAAPEPSLSESFPVQPPRNRPARRPQRTSNQARPSAPSRRAPERVAQTPISGVQVWVNTNSDVYHMPGMRYYGKTKEGYYATETQAQIAGFRRAAR